MFTGLIAGQSVLGRVQWGFGRSLVGAFEMNYVGQPLLAFEQILSQAVWFSPTLSWLPLWFRGYVLYLTATTVAEGGWTHEVYKVSFLPRWGSFLE